MTFLITEYGKPHPAKGFGAWMEKRCKEAGLEGCSSHGLRKAAARRLAEAGCTNQQIKAIAGHKTDKEVSRYTAAANQITLSDQAMLALGGLEREQQLANFKVADGEPGAKMLKTKGSK
jgi:integrase